MLAVMLLDKVVKEKYESKFWNSRHKCHINDLRTSRCVPEKEVVIHSYRAEIADSQMQSRFNSQLHRKCLLLKSRLWLGKNEILYTEKKTRGKALIGLEHGVPNY